MTQPTTHPSSYNSNFSSADMPNTGIYTGCQPVALSPSVDPGVAHNSDLEQHGNYPSPVADVLHATYVDPNPLLSATAPSPQHPSNACPRSTTPDAPHTFRQACLHQRNGAGLTMDSASASLPQAPSVSLGQKRVAEDLEDRDTKRIKMGSSETPLSPETHARRDVCERHWDDSCEKLAAEGALSSCSATYEGSLSSASASSVGAPTAVFAFSLPTTATRTPDSSLPDTTLTETTDEATELESWTDNGVQEPTWVASQSQVEEIILGADIHRDFDIWRWINEIEDFEDPVLPISEPPSSLLPETLLAEAAEDPDVWKLINELEDFVEPDLPPSESPADAAEDPDFCNHPIRTLLICSWLDSYGSALHQRSPSELAFLSPALVDYEK